MSTKTCTQPVGHQFSYDRFKVIVQIRSAMQHDPRIIKLTSASRKWFTMCVIRMVFTGRYLGEGQNRNRRAIFQAWSRRFQKHILPDPAVRSVQKVHRKRQKRCEPWRDSRRRYESGANTWSWILPDFKLRGGETNLPRDHILQVNDFQDWKLRSKQASPSGVIRAQTKKMSDHLAQSVENKLNEPQLHKVEDNFDRVSTVRFVEYREFPTHDPGKRSRSGGEGVDCYSPPVGLGEQRQHVAFWRRQGQKSLFPLEERRKLHFLGESRL